MEFMLASLASKTRKGVICSMNHTVTDRALFNSLKFLVEVALPYSYCLSYRTILKLDTNIMSAKYRSLVLKTKANMSLPQWSMTTISRQGMVFFGGG